MRFTRPLLIVAVTTLGSPLAAVEDDLPKADTILERYVEATGGRAAYEKLKNRIVEGTFELPATGMKGAIKLYFAAPNKTYSSVAVEGIGTEERGYNGDIAWQTSAMMGPRILEGEELANTVREATFNAELKWRELYSKVETVGTEDIDGKTAYKVIMTPKEGRPSESFYDKESGLLVQMVSTQVSPMGEQKITATLTDYEKFDGIQMPTQTRISSGPQEFVIKIDKVTHNSEIPADRFALPSEIKELMEKDKGTPADASAKESKAAEKATTQPKKEEGGW